MPEQKPVGKLGAVFQTVVGSGITPTGNVAIGFDADDGRRYQIDIAPGCAPLCMVAIGSCLSKIAGDHGQPIRITSVQGGKFVGGSPMLFLGLEDGGQLPLLLEAGDVNELIALLQNISTPPETPTH